MMVSSTGVFYATSTVSDITLPTGKAIIYIPSDKPGPPITHSFNESEARGRPSRPDKPADKNVQVKVSEAGHNQFHFTDL